MGPKAPDIAAAAIVRGEVRPTAPTSQDTMQVQVAQRVKEANARSALQAGAEVRNRVPSQTKIDKKVEQIGTRNATGVMERAPGSAQETRYINTGAHAEIAKKFFEVGYDKLPPGFQQKITDAVFAAARNNPLTTAEAASIASNPLKIKKFAERIIKEDPKFAAEVAKNFEKWANSPEIVDIVTPLKIKEAEVTYKRDEAKIDLADITRQLEDVNRDLVAYQRTAIAGLGAFAGGKARELDLLRKNAQTIVGEADSLRKQEADAVKNLEAIRAKGVSTKMPANSAMNLPERIVTGPDTEAMNEAQGKLTDIRNNLAKKEADIARLQTLEQEEARLNAERQRLEREQRLKQHDLALAEMELIAATGNRADAERLRESEEVDIEKKIDEIFALAAESTLDSQVEAYLTAADEQLTTWTDQQKDEKIKQVGKILQGRYSKPVPGTWYRKEGTAIDKQNVNDDYATLMREGPEGVMINILRTQRNPDTGGPYTPDEAKAFLAANPDYVEKTQPAMLNYLLTRRLKTGGISADEADVITMSPWGQGVITEALNKNAEHNSEVKGLMEAGGLARHGFWDRLRDEIKKNPSLLMLLLTGGIAALPLAIAGGVLGAGAGVAGAGIFGGAMSGIVGGGAVGHGITSAGRAYGIAPEDETALAA